MAERPAKRDGTKRLMKELEDWEAGRRDEKLVERLGPVNDSDLFTWEAVFNGHGIGGGYDDGRWLLTIRIPPSYPNGAPAVSFSTAVVHPNVSLETGEICLDLLRDRWSPAYTVLEVVRAVRLLLAYPEIESPLNVDVAALLRDGDHVGARALVELWCRGEGGRYDGP